MKRKVCKSAHPAALAVAVTVLLAFTVLASASPSLAASPEPGMATSGKASKTERVEVRIKELHAKLKITPAQEGLWDNVTRVMRDNAILMESLIKSRSENAGTKNAVADLKSYAAIAEAHADGLKKFIPAFEPLYAGMSDEQKKDADTLFHRQGPAKAKGKARARAKATAETKALTEGR